MRVFGIFAELNETAASLGGVGLGVGVGDPGFPARSCMLHFGQRPGLDDVTSGCIGHS
jgi:hypothetical protein